MHRHPKKKLKIEVEKQKKKKWILIYILRSSAKLDFYSILAHIQTNKTHTYTHTQRDADTPNAHTATHFRCRCFRVKLLKAMILKLLCDFIKLAIYFFHSLSSIQRAECVRMEWQASLERIERISPAQIKWTKKIYRNGCRCFKIFIFFLESFCLFSSFRSTRLFRSYEKNSTLYSCNVPISCKSSGTHYFSFMIKANMRMLNFLESATLMSAR